jgi:Molybdopterin-binding domain of aldehyde dehydrogenase
VATPAQWAQYTTAHACEILLKGAHDADATCAAQAALAVPDEGGTITVHSATQSVDAVQRSVATTLGIPFHQVLHAADAWCRHSMPSWDPLCSATQLGSANPAKPARRLSTIWWLSSSTSQFAALAAAVLEYWSGSCTSYLVTCQDAKARAALIKSTRARQVKVVCRRLGGAFGGKCSRCLPPAAAAAVAATKLHKPVRYVLTREDDMRQNQGGSLMLASNRTSN